MEATFRMTLGIAVFLTALSGPTALGQVGDEGPRMGGQRITQEQIENGQLSLRAIRRAGLRVFATPFNQHDGYGDGPMDPNDPITPGGRPTLQGNGTFLRVNGLDGQSCLDCHSVVSNATVPAMFGIGGVGTPVTNVMFQPTEIDVIDEGQNGMAGFNGRFINPPFLFGSGAVELLAKEMTAELQALKAAAQRQPGVDIALVTKGVSFGTLRFENGEFDTAGVAGINDDLVVRPFGRKGEFATVRAFDLEALPFHFGMQPAEVVGAGIDDDQDGLADEVLVGEVSALSIFATNLERPVQRPLGRSAQNGAQLFSDIGCAECHIPALTTDSPILTYSFPEIAADPTANVYARSNLGTAPTQFETTPEGGLIIRLFADLKRHDMGSALAEAFGSPLDRLFTTARLWGVADTAPYMHDGRSLTLGEAIMRHGGEAQGARDAFADLDGGEQTAVLDFLRSLRTPRRTAVGLLPLEDDPDLGVSP